MTTAMAFQPFGYRFDIRAPMRSREVKAAINTRLKSWFDPNQGARGWILGRYLCLWSSALNRNGPMVLGRIVDDGFASRIRGRAGSDLNGTIWMIILMLLFGFTFLPALLAGEVQQGEALFYFGLFAVLVPLVLWFSHADRREADHLVRFIEDVVTPEAKARRVAAKGAKIHKSLEMDVSGEKASDPVTGSAIYEALLATGIGDFIILSSDDETYIQTLGKQAGLIIEKREGSADQHYRAVRGRQLPPGEGEGEHFTFEEAWEVISAYVSDLPLPSFVEWDRMALGTDVYAAE